MSDDHRDAIESTSPTAVSDSGSPVKTEPAAALCPYCGSITPTGARCSHCRGLLDPLSRQATTNTMGPWFIRDDAQPFRPGCSYHTLLGLIQRGKITRTTIIRGPSTRQFWMFAGKVPGVAHLLGVCHSCQEESHVEDFACNNCGAVFTAEEDRQRLGLGPVMEVPGQALPDTKPATKDASASPVRRPAANPAPRSVIEEDAPWQEPPRKSSGALVGGVILAIAALAAAGFAVKTWVDANQPHATGIPQTQPATVAPPSPDAAPIQTPASPPPTQSVPSKPSPHENAQGSVPETTATPARDAEHPQSATAGTEVPAPVAWSNVWRLARGLP